MIELAKQQSKGQYDAGHCVALRQVGKLCHSLAGRKDATSAMQE